MTHTNSPMIGEIIRLTPNGAVIRPEGLDTSRGNFAHNSCFMQGKAEVGAVVEFTPYRTPNRRNLAFDVRVLTVEQVEARRCLG
ncbi:MAG: hypothetical protein ABS54_06305 [Hyphomicrobium sp. SCN 65-11]|nr:MAG: hypothetical protein ABS54_06305 [Hyphomicrobium sp. SCN 65-11]